MLFQIKKYFSKLQKDYLEIMHNNMYSLPVLTTTLQPLFNKV